MTTLTLPNSLQLDLIESGGHFLGFGEVRHGETTLRSARRPAFCEIRNPSGIEFLNYTITDTTETPTGVILKFAMQRRAGGLMEWMVHEVRNRYNTGDWTALPHDAPDTSLELELRAVNRTLGGREYAGYSYQYRYRSESVAIYKILDRGSWEIGGRAVGNQFWMRNCFVPSIVNIESEAQFHSTEWFIPDCANPSVFQFLPLQTELQGFSFTASEQGALVTWATEVSHVRSLFEKPRGSDVLVHFHELCGDLSLDFKTPPVDVLFTPGNLDRVELANAYEAVRDLVHESLHAEIGMRRERVTTYGQIEEWGLAQMDYYRGSGVPKLLDAGMKTVYLANHFQNNTNTWRVGNMCCTVDYQVSDTVTEESLRALCDAIRAGGAHPEMWGNTALSALSWLFHWERRPAENPADERIGFLPREDSLIEIIWDAPAPFVRNASNGIECDHYSPMFLALNLREPVVFEYWTRRWKEAHDKVGLEGIFLDSSFNLSSDKFHWVQNVDSNKNGGTADNPELVGFYRPAHDPRAAILSQYRAHLDLMIAMQQSGYRYCNEDLGVFGIHRHGPGIEKRLDCLFLWPECIGEFDILSIEKAGADPDDVFFRGLAYRMMWSLHWNIPLDSLSFASGQVRGEFDVPTERHINWFKAFNEVSDDMQGREILPGETGVLYRNGDRQMLWAFADLEHDLGCESRVRDVTCGEEFTIDVLKAKPQHVYVF